MSESEATKFGISESERRRFVRIGDAKKNMAPMMSASWMELISVSLDNATADIPADRVQVATAWTPPDPFDGVERHHLIKVQHRIAAGEYRADMQADAWVGKVVLEVLGLDDTPLHRTKVKHLLATWMDNGMFKVITRKDGNYKERKFIQVGERAQ